MKHSSYPHPADDWTAVMLNVTAVVFGSWTAWALVAVIVALCGCSGQRRVAVVAARYPTSFAKECASRYPVKDSTVTNTVYREGAVQLIPGDTVRVDCDTVHEYTSGGVISRVVRVPCPPQQLRVDTFYVTTFRQVENTARVAAVTADLGDCVALSKRLRHTNTVYLLWAVITSLLIVGTVVLRFVRPKLF